MNCSHKMDKRVNISQLSFADLYAMKRILEGICYLATVPTTNNIDLVKKMEWRLDMVNRELGKRISGVDFELNQVE